MDPDGETWFTAQQLVDRFFSQPDRRRILDAGCGSGEHVRFSPDARVVGIDISPEQLQKNPYLDERIAADLQTCDLSGYSFDGILCWYVLEHLDRPGAALERLMGALAPGGVLLLACPNPYSLKGMLTRLLPHSLHVWFYKRLLHDENAGQEGRAPFRTVMSREMTPANIRALAARHHLALELETGFDWARATRRKGPGALLKSVGFALEAPSRVVSIVSQGRYRPDLSEYSYVFRRTA
ncbi:MAG: class I SAM-dependent methyltransferase [Thermoleophilia bacterium]|nr:class I SAM-dependent methyltransferase [Thermoleophilia bacterium]